MVAKSIEPRSWRDSDTREFCNPSIVIGGRVAARSCRTAAPATSRNRSSVRVAVEPAVGVSLDAVIVVNFRNCRKWEVAQVEPVIRKCHRRGGQVTPSARSSRRLGAP